MRFIATAAGFALALTAYPAIAEDAKPNDAQIAHIAYTAGSIDIKAAQLALQKSKNKEVRDCGRRAPVRHARRPDPQPARCARWRGLPLTIMHLYA